VDCWIDGLKREWACDDWIEFQMDWIVGSMD
jgi:hypothetical protein